MTRVPCDACGAVLVATPAHAGLSVRCASCGATLRVPEAERPPVAVEEERRLPPDPSSERVVPDPSRAASGAVPPPIASGADKDATVVLTAAVGSLVLPLFAPFVLWYVLTLLRRIEEQDGEAPRTLRTARNIAIAGVVLLGLAVVCTGLFVLMLG